MERRSCDWTHVVVAPGRYKSETGTRLADGEFAFPVVVCVVIHEAAGLGVVRGMFRLMIRPYAYGEAFEDRDFVEADSDTDSGRIRGFVIGEVSAHDLDGVAAEGSGFGCLWAFRWIWITDPHTEVVVNLTLIGDRHLIDLSSGFTFDVVLWTPALCV